MLLGRPTGPPNTSTRILQLPHYLDDSSQPIKSSDNSFYQKTEQPYFLRHAPLRINRHRMQEASNHNKAFNHDDGSNRHRGGACVFCAAHIKTYC